MKNANKLIHGRKFLIGAIVAFVILGSGLSFLNTSSISQSLMSQFSGVGNSWQSSPNNPKRSTLSTNYTARIDPVIANMLSRGQVLDQTRYINYLSSISSGMKALGAEPVYASNMDIQNIIGYIDYELTDTKTKLSSGEMFFDRLKVLVDNSVSANSAGGGVVTTTSTNTSTTTTTTSLPVPTVSIAGVNIADMGVAKPTTSTVATVFGNTG